MAMTRAHDLPDVIPIFPLPGALLLPRARLPLHIFEPRYVAMLDDCLKTQSRLIGMIQPNPTAKSDGITAALHDIGCAGRITQFSETEDGRYMITLAGQSRFRIKREIDGFAPYRRAEIDWTGFGADLNDSETDPGFDRKSFLDLLGRYLAAQSLDTDWDTMAEADDELLINSLSMLLSFEPKDKQALLQSPTLTHRRETLVTLIEYALRGGDDTGPLQ